MVGIDLLWWELFSSVGNYYLSGHFTNCCRLGCVDCIHMYKTALFTVILLSHCKYFVDYSVFFKMEVFVGVIADSRKY